MNEAMLKEEGGPAFPVDLFHGMTLRDYFAAKAMQAAMARLIRNGENADSVEVAESAYRIADAMLDVRKGPPEGKS